MTSVLHERAAQLLQNAPTRLHIDGEWTTSADASWIEVCDPASGEVIAQVANGTVEDAIEAVNAASTAAEEWAARRPRDRGEILRRAFELTIANREALASLVVLENGKTIKDARAEIDYAAEFFRWYADEAVRNVGSITRAPNADNRILVVHQPIGIAVLVTPWNFPAAMLTRKIGPALAAGCTVVCKPASETPLTALMIAQLLQRAGVPRGVVNIVPSSRSSAVVKAMLADPRVRKLSFTGSTEVGRTLLAEAANNVISTSMELGGNAPFVIFEDADLDLAVEGAMVAKMRNGGEACTAANRFLVHAKVADAFGARFAKAMQQLKVGSGLDESVDLGPLVNEPSRAKVSELVDMALDDGAERLIGGRIPDGPGWFYPATVLAGVSPSSAIVNTEIFGPVAPIVTFEGEDEAVRLANDTELGLVAYVYTNDMARGLRVAERIESGMVGLNRGLVSDPAAPFGGVKQSGIGREGGHDGMLEYLEAKYIACSW